MFSLRLQYFQVYSKCYCSFYVQVDEYQILNLTMDSLVFIKDLNRVFDLFY